MSAQTLVFINDSEAAFTCNYGGVPYTVPAGKDLVVPAYLGKHFAKHWIDKQMIADGKIPQLNNEHERKDYEARCLGNVQVEVSNDEQAVVAALNANRKETAEAEAHECSECGKTAKSKAGLAAHMRTHQEEEFED